MTSRQKVALVTGAGDPDALGAAICRDLVKRGYRVYGTGRSMAKTLFLQKEGCDVLELNIASKESIDNALAEVRAKAGRLDLLVNNAAVCSVAGILDTDPDAFRQVFDVNVFGLLHMMQAFTPLLIDSATGGTRTMMINVGSVQAALGVPWQSAYGSSKAAGQLMTDVLRKEVRALGVDVVNVELCTVKTPMNGGGKGLFDTSAKVPSGYYKLDVINPIRDEDARKTAEKTGHTPARAAKDILDQSLTAKPPLKIWPGGGGLIFKYLFGVIIPYSVIENKLMKDRACGEVNK